MNAKEKKLVRTITEAMLMLPTEKREFMHGYAEGVIAMSAAKRQSAPQPRDRDG